MSEEKKKKMYYGGKEKTAIETRKKAEEEMMPYPFRDMQRDFDRMMERFEHQFDDFWSLSRQIPGRRWRRQFAMMPFRGTMPSVDLEDLGKDFRLMVDMPGFNKEDVNIEVTDDSVTIQANKSEAKEENKKNYVHRERIAQSFYRRIPLPESIRSDDAKANLDKGTLEITLPKKEPKQTKKLKVT
ncbi:MAG TPA: Hsp20/alpha crystallin family protein [Candidatus Sulfotelmatobacter sp.]|nr:Hsp20/alpha crystallin family protein [Candidatus Sulfotelmatobacter sp.]